MRDYKINYTPFSDFGIKVISTQGIYDIPKRIGKVARDWGDTPGLEAFVKSSDIYFAQQVIEFELLFYSNSVQGFQLNLSNFKQIIYKDSFKIDTPFALFTCIAKESAKVDIISNKYNENYISAKTKLKFHVKSSYYYHKDELIARKASINEFSIDNIAFSTFGMVVEKTDGYFDFTRMKSDNYTRFRSESETVNKRKERYINIEGLIFSKNYADFASNIYQFQQKLKSEGLKELNVPIAGFYQKLNVFLSKGMQVKNISVNENNVSARFKIVLTEPDPVVQTFAALILKDVDGTPILANDNKYIYLIVDIDVFAKEYIYLYIVEEPDYKDVFVYNINEGDYSPVYIYTKEEYQNDILQ